MAIIEVNHLTKEYRLGALTNVKESSLNLLRRIGGRKVHRRSNFKALDDVNFTIEEGEVIGIIGPNGAGKSTLLKHLANISKPTFGTVKVRGKVAPLIEVGAGVNPELTGRENIFLNGAILGIPKKIIRQKLDSIIDFSELEEFIDTPVKRYSSGMTVKLGFSIATSMDAEILIVDEVLAVGDLAFQRKCFDRMEDMIKRQNKTVLVVSHNLRQIEKLCSKVMLLKQGQIEVFDKPKKVCDIFYRQSDELIVKKLGQKGRANTENEEMKLISLELTVDGKRAEKIKYLDDVVINIKYQIKKPLPLAVFGVGVHTTDFVNLSTHHSNEELEPKDLSPGIYHLKCRINQFPFLPGAYSIRAGMSSGRLNRLVFYAENLFNFQVLAIEEDKEDLRQGFVAMNTQWQLGQD